MHTDAHIKAIESVLGYTFKDKALLRQAFTRTSFCNEHHARGTGEDYQSNEVLEFFGDAVLSAAIISLLIENSSRRYAHGIHTELSEGDFSSIKAHLSDKSNLSVAMGRTGLQRYLLMGEGDIKLGMENEPSVMEDLFESIVGAVYIDSDGSIDAVIKTVGVMLDISVYLDRNPAPAIQSYKNLLQEWCADKRRRLPLPKYKKISEDGPDHDKRFTVEVHLNSNVIGVGSGHSKKNAEQAAARKALELMGVEL